MTTDTDNDPRCAEPCEGCDNLPYGESVRKEQLAMMTASIQAQAVFSRLMTESEKLVAGSPEAELVDLAMAAMMYGSAFASVIGMLLKDAPELAHRAVTIHQDMYSNGDVWFTEELYAEAEEVAKQRAAWVASKVAERDVAAVSA